MQYPDHVVQEARRLQAIAHLRLLKSTDLNEINELDEQIERLERMIQQQPIFLIGKRSGIANL